MGGPRRPRRGARDHERRAQPALVRAGQGPRHDDGLRPGPGARRVADGPRRPGRARERINKVFDVFDGTIEFAVSNVNAAEGEVGGVFVSSQASDTDLGSKTPKKVLSKGIFYGRVVKQ